MTNIWVVLIVFALGYLFFLFLAANGKAQKDRDYRNKLSKDRTKGDEDKDGTYKKGILDEIYDGIREKHRLNGIVEFKSDRVGRERR